MKKIYLYLITLLVLMGCASDPTPRAGGGYLAVESVWTQRVGHGTEDKHLLHRLAVDGDRLYAASYREIAAFERNDGKEIWRRRYEGAINTGLIVSGDSLLYGGDAELVALSRSTGEPLWHAAVSSEILTTPIIASGMAIVRTVDGKISAHDTGSGEQIWSYQIRVPVLSLRGNAAPAVLGETIYVGTDNGHVVALDLKKGELLWDSTLAVAHGRNEIERLVDVDAPLLLTGYGIIASAYQKGTMLLSMQSGRIVWKRDLISVGGAVVDSDQFYFGDLDGNLWALSINQGATYWKQPRFKGRELSQPAIQADMVVIGDNHGYVHWFSKDDGSKRFSRRVTMPKEKFPLKSTTNNYNQSFNEKRAILASPLVVDDWSYL
ncbi:MAG: outer membrane protein assembly factor BamB, partial [Gammaproteobacteria bacterium]|nr:outer membrane protein assembly factor BamB [Gammaproteobacteria bacterium]